MHGPNEGVSEETDEANSAVKIVGGNVFVELDPDHPGFKDEGYRDRRNEIAKIRGGGDATKGNNQIARRILNKAS